MFKSNDNADVLVLVFNVKMSFDIHARSKDSINGFLGQAPAFFSYKKFGSSVDLLSCVCSQLMPKRLEHLE
jgi:hypothetical protein